MRERDRRRTIAASRANPQPAIRNVIRPVAETVRIKSAPSSLPEGRSLPDEGPTDLDRSVEIRAIKRGMYYPGRMGDPTEWTRIIVLFQGKEIPAWLERCSGRDSDYSKLRLECYDLDEIEDCDWYEVNETLTYKSITSTSSNFRHVEEVLDELIRDGSVSIR